MSDRRAASAPGTLVLVATPIGNLGDLSPRAVATLSEADLVCCEDTRHTGVLLKSAGISARRLLSLHEHNEATRVAQVLEVLASGGLVALVSDAGTPLVSDPGTRLVRGAIDAGFTVSAVPGPSALLHALVVSGLSTERFVFEGFLARKGTARRERLAAIAAASMPSVIYEAPGRVQATIEDLAALVEPTRRVCVARELTKRFEEVFRGSITDAQSWLASAPARGEYVLVIDGTAEDLDGGLNLDDALTALFEAGLGAREAVVALQVLRGVPHRSAYERALALRGAHQRPTETS